MEQIEQLLLRTAEDQFFKSFQSDEIFFEGGGGLSDSAY